MSTILYHGYEWTSTSTTPIIVTTSLVSDSIIDSWQASRLLKRGTRTIEDRIKPWGGRSENMAFDVWDNPLSKKKVFY